MIKNLRVCDSENQLAAEPPYRFTFEYEDFSPQKIAAEIRNENGDVIWQNEEDYKIPIVLAKVELERLDFEYEYNDGNFNCTIPNRRLDIEPRVADIAEEIGFSEKKCRMMRYDIIDKMKNVV